MDNNSGGCNPIFVLTRLFYILPTLFSRTDISYRYTNTQELHSIQTHLSNLSERYERTISREQFTGLIEMFALLRETELLVHVRLCIM